MAETKEKKLPQLKSFDQLLKNAEAEKNRNLSQEEAKSTIYRIVSFADMEDHPGHRFHLYDGERKADMVHSIRTKGILQDIILRPKGDGKYYILSGHNRKHCGMEAGLTETLCKIKLNLTDEEAWIYVVETNLMQRSFSEMKHSEKAAVIVLHYSKMFSQGKRNDILNEIQNLENPHEIKGKETSAQNEHKLNSRDALGQRYGLDASTIARYLRIDKLIIPLKLLLDDGKIPFVPAVKISFLKKAAQEYLAQCMTLNNFRIDQKKADTLKRYSDTGNLTEENAYLILNGELTLKPKVNRTPVVKVSKAVYAKYFTPKQSQKDISVIVEKALELYFSKEQ